MDFYRIAAEELDSEISQFDMRPTLYLSGLGWPHDDYPRINELKNQISPTKDDIVKLQNIMEGLIKKYEDQPDEDLVTSILEDGKISDYTVNFVAGKITQLYKNLK